MYRRVPLQIKVHHGRESESIIKEIQIVRRRYDCGKSIAAGIRRPERLGNQRVHIPLSATATGCCYTVHVCQAQDRVVEPEVVPGHHQRGQQVSFVLQHESLAVLVHVVEIPVVPLTAVGESRVKQ